MDSSLRVARPPATEPVTAALAQQHCRIDGDADDLLLAGHITAARMWVEGVLARALITQGLVWTMADRSQHGSWPAMPAQLLYAPAAVGWPSRLMRPLDLPRAPVASVEGVTLRDHAGTDTLLDPSLWALDQALEPAKLRLHPQVVGGPVRHVQVAFTAGYGTTPDTVPMPIRQAILLLTAFLYENRGDAGGELPRAAEWLLAPYRIAFFAG